MIQMSDKWVVQKIKDTELFYKRVKYQKYNLHSGSGILSEVEFKIKLFLKQEFKIKLD